MSGPGPDDESPPDEQRRLTPAERAGATPLDPELFKLNAGMPVGQRNRELLGLAPGGDASAEPVEPVVRRRRSTSRSSARRGTARPWLIGAATVGLLAAMLLVAGVVVEEDVAVAAAAPPELVAVTPVLSARRAPELLARPVATRNLAAAVEPVLAAAPPDTCLQVRDGENVVATRNDAAALVPASNLKLVTGAAVLGLLDADSRLTTRFVTDGRPTDGNTVRGNLYMVGGGDPLLSTEAYLGQLPNGRQPATDMAAVADQIAATGIRRITGSVVGDESRYDTVRTVEAWPDRFVSQGQVSPLSALVVDDSWVPGVGVQPDPAIHSASVLTELLEARGVKVDGEPGAGAAPADAAPLLEIDSLTIAQLVDQGLRFSDNTTMEMLLKEVGLDASGNGSTAAGLAAVRGWLEGTDLPAEGVVVDDGSGLSDRNRVTCALLAGVLSAEGPRGVLADGLARPGEPGTLDDRFLEDSLRDRVRAKTGTLRAVTALSGWLRTVPERDLGFAFVLTRPDGRVSEADTLLQSTLLEAMTSYPQVPDDATLAPAAPAPGGA